MKLSKSTLIALLASLSLMAASYNMNAYAIELPALEPLGQSEELLTKGKEAEPEALPVVGKYGSLINEMKTALLFIQDYCLDKIPAGDVSAIQVNKMIQQCVKAKKEWRCYKKVKNGLKVIEKLNARASKTGLSKRKLKRIHKKVKKIWLRKIDPCFVQLEAKFSSVSVEERQRRR